jgi:Mg-chelatase subunit ChlD
MAVHTVELLEGRDSTNIYNALQKAINMVHERDDKSRNPAILFFTDGVPNVSPARGEIEALKKNSKKIEI